ncbi:hypothetical protein KFK09_020802 [Dendrobium nobile]|uniref:SWIM-type domain-containing protein n=1 Tax=Dendrobium nobile TaxID=94219 RepID=A0A8T3ANF3_DENNO|nr:hypothetical protein KFK09_020801 [Dendrobium nobile]KAI0497571.1 hypothetical protein KFK09_020802 [Dendrobium nobile]
MSIISETDVMDMLTYSSDSHKMEVVVVVKELEEDIGIACDSQHVHKHDTSGNIMTNNDIIVGGMSEGILDNPDLEENTLIVGSRFEDSFSFKQVIRSNAIIHNFDITIKASDKSRVIATCSYRGCPWRIRGCRFLIGVDACHLKSKYLGVLLSANCLDGNNGLFTIAFVVAESESRKSWEWFLKNLLEALNCDIEHLAFISDMEKGLGEAIKVVFPTAEHRVCMRHFWKNIKKFFRCEDGHKLQKLVWKAANTFSQHNFNAYFEEIRSLSPGVYSYLSALKCKWSKSTFSLHIKNHYNTNNMSESFNAWVEEARSKPVVDLIDMVRGMMMEQRSQRKINCSSWKGPLVPCVEEYLRDVTTTKNHFIIRESTSTKAEVEGRNDRHEVDIENRICSCGFWQVCGLPCIHGASFIGSKHYNLWHTYVDEHYYTFRYKMAYDGAIRTLPGKEQWMILSDGEVVGPPISRRPRGRPKKRRIKNFLETTKKAKLSHKCGRCNSWGHHRSTCKNPLNGGSVDNYNEFEMPTTSAPREKMPIRRADHEDNCCEY